MANLTKFSQRGVNRFRTRVDIDALSVRAAWKGPDVRRVVISTAAGQKQTAVFTQNATVKHNLGPVGHIGTLNAAYISCETLPAGGTLTVKLVAYDASANTEIDLTDTVNPEGLTVREAGAFTLAATNVELAAEDTLELHCIASDDAVGTDAQGVAVACMWSPTESAVISETA